MSYQKMKCANKHGYKSISGSQEADICDQSCKKEVRSSMETYSETDVIICEIEKDTWVTD